MGNNSIRSFGLGFVCAFLVFLTILGIVNLKFNKFMSENKIASDNAIVSTEGNSNTVTNTNIDSNSNVARITVDNSNKDNNSTVLYEQDYTYEGEKRYPVNKVTDYLCPACQKSPLYLSSSSGSAASTRLRCTSCAYESPEVYYDNCTDKSVPEKKICELWEANQLYGDYEFDYNKGE